MSTKTLRLLSVALICIFTMNVLEAQTPKWKELHTESDGFQWYEYTYEKNSNDNYPIAAFDLKGKRLTCNTEYLINYEPGYFKVWTGNDANEEQVYAIYNKQGKCIVSRCLDVYFSDGYIQVATMRDFNDDFVYALYDMYGGCIIPDKFGFTDITLSGKNGLRGVMRKNANGEDELMTISSDGKYYADDYYVNEPLEFEAKKKPIATLGRGAYVSKITSSSTSSSNSLNSTKDNGLLYEGDYTEGPWINPNTGYSQPAPNPHHHIKIYEDHIVIDMLNLSCSGKSSSGEKMFINSWSNITYYVDNFFNIRSTFPYGYSQFTKGNVVYDMNAPVQNYDDGDYNGGTKGTNGDYKGGQTRPSTKDCPVCHTTGNCQTCLGRGWVTGLDNQRHDCPTCHGNKVCWKCNGSGKVSTH